MALVYCTSAGLCLQHLLAGDAAGSCDLVHHLCSRMQPCRGVGRSVCGNIRRHINLTELQVLYLHTDPDAPEDGAG